MESKYAKGMKCKYCGKEMELNSCEFIFKGHQDDYLICPKCRVSCIVKVRHDKIWKKEWGKEDGK